MTGKRYLACRFLSSNRQEGVLKGFALLNRVLFLVVIFAGLVGCASYSQKIQSVRESIVAQNPQQALAELEQIYEEDDRDVLYFLEKGQLLRMSGKFSDSNMSFERAKSLLDDTSALSLTETAGSLLVNERVRSYSGAIYEKAMLHLYEALNYLQMGKPDEARVEALQVNDLLESYVSDLPQGTPDENSGHSDRFVNDAFSFYLTGMIFEGTRDLSDALINYRRAYHYYRQYEHLFGVRPPVSLRRGLLRLTRFLGLHDEFDGYVSAFGMEADDEVKAQGRADLVVLLHLGLAPQKHSVFITQPDPTSGHIYRIALPAYGKRYIPVQQAAVKISKREAIDLDVAEDIDGIARTILEEQMPGLIARGIARAVLKAKTKKQFDDNDAAFLGLVTEVASFVTEVADTRGWLSLPGQIRLGRTFVDPGTYTVRVELRNHQGQVIDLHDRKVTLVPGKQVYLEFYFAGRPGRDIRGPDKDRDLL